MKSKRCGDCSLQEFTQHYLDNTAKQTGIICGVTERTVKNFASKNGIRKNDTMGVEHKPQGGEEMEKKTGIESRHDDRVVINWTTKTILTDLGEFGQYSCNFTTHSAIQRYYVNSYEGKGHTSAEVAMKFNFAHSKAVLLYAKLHGFTKASPGQTDIEFEEGLTVEEAVEENIQALKRRTVRQTEIKKWQQVQKDADKWNHFENSVIYPMEEWVKINLPKYKPQKVTLKASTSPFSAVVGLSDWHYLKHCFDHNGNATYNRKLARKALEQANSELIRQMEMYGKPEMFFIPSGSDDYHIDNRAQTTTAGTPQARQTDGDWELDMETFIDTILGVIELYRQIAPVTILPMYGNHNNKTAIMLQNLLRVRYQDTKDCTVVMNKAPRVYQKYGKNGFVFQHGKTPATAKFQREAQKYFLVEAKQQGINLNTTPHLTAFTGDLHHDSYKDLGGVKHFIIPSLAPSDSWHQEQGFIGSKKEASLYIFDKKEGRKAVFYS